MASGHDYFFAFAEVEYNDITQQFESTVSVSSHDVERIFAENGWSLNDLESYEKENEHFAPIEKWLLDQFTFSTNSQQITLSLLACEIELNGMIHFYIQSTPTELGPSLTVKFNLLMSNFSEQQNKLTLYYRDQTITKSFLQTAFLQEIRLENN